MYSSSRAKTIVKKDVAFLSAGIHENAFLTNVKYEVTDKGSKFIEFKFEKDGQVLTHTEWEPSKKTFSGELTEEEFLDKCDNQFRRIEQILLCFYKPEELEVENINSFKEFASWAVELLDKDFSNVPLKVKVVYNDKGYTTLPKYAAYTFIESMSSVAENGSKIKTLRWDQFERPVIADRNTAASSPYAVVDGTVSGTSEGKDNPNDLPF